MEERRSLLYSDSRLSNTVTFINWEVKNAPNEWVI